MKLLVYVTFGFVALIGSEAFSNIGDNQDAQIRVGDNYQQYDQNFNDLQYKESSWDVQSRHDQNDQNEYDQNQNVKSNDQDESFSIGSPFSRIGTWLFQRSSSASEASSQEDYIKDKNEIIDTADMISQSVAQKMVKFYNIVEKYAAHNGSVMTDQIRDTLSLRQWALPIRSHQFLSMNDASVNGLGKGLIKSAYFDAEKNSVDLEYFFNYLLVNGALKSNTGPKGTFNLKMTDTNVNVSTELKNRNRNKNYGHTRNGNTEFEYHGIQNTGAENQEIGDNAEDLYVQFVNRAVESEMIENSFGGLLGCLRSEMGSSFDASVQGKSDMVIENKKSQLTVSFLRARQWTENQMTKQRKVQRLGLIQNQSGNGYKLMVRVVLSESPSWEADVAIQKANQKVNINNVNFHAQKIVATAVLERPQQPSNSENGLNVEHATVRFQGLRFDIGKFDLAQSANEQLAREVGQNMQKVLENGMSAALQKQLYLQQRICQQTPEKCARCNQNDNY